MSSHHQIASEALRTDIANSRLLATATRSGKLGKLMTPELAVNLLADLVFVMLLLLLFAWVGLWALVS